MEFQPKDSKNNNCEDGPHFGNKSLRYDYIMKGLAGEDDYPDDACPPWYHGNFQVDNIKVNENVNVSGKVTAGSFQGPINVQSWKGFDIAHPNKSDYRLRHICLEGPEAGVYFRGRLKDSNVIELPNYWKGLIDPETITISLTQIGYSQDLIVDCIIWGQKVIIKSGNGSNIDCYYTIQASRIDGEPLIVEYIGKTPKDYPGNSDQYSISGYDY